MGKTEKYMIKGKYVLKCRRCGKIIIADDTQILADDKEKFREAAGRYPMRSSEVSFNSWDIMFGCGEVKDNVLTHWCDEWKTEVGILEFAGANIYEE